MVIGMLKKNVQPLHVEASGQSLNAVSLSGLDTIKRNPLDIKLVSIQESAFPDILGKPKAPDPKNKINTIGHSPLLKKFICQVIQTPHLEDLFQTVIDTVKKEKYSRKKEEDMRNLTSDDLSEFDNKKRNVFSSIGS